MGLPHSETHSYATTAVADEESGGGVGGRGGSGGREGQENEIGVFRLVTPKRSLQKGRSTPRTAADVEEAWVPDIPRTAKRRPQERGIMRTVEVDVSDAKR